MARPRPRILLVSRDLAENLVVAGGTAKAPVDAAAIRMLVTLLSRAGAVVLDKDEDILQAEAARRLYDPERRFYDYLFLGLRALRLDLGRIDRKVLLGLMPRVAALQVGLRDEPGYRPGPAVMAFISDRNGQTIDARTVVGRVKIERTFAAAAADMVDAIPVDPRVLRRLRTRHSLVLYLRAMAWLQRPPEGAKTAANGKVWFEVPYAEAQGWLGTAGIASRSNVTQNVFGPAMRELAEVGVDLTLKWKENYRGQPTHLRIGVASTPASRRQALAELSRRRAARLAERRAARPDLPALRYEARLQRYVEAGGSATMFRLRYLSRLWRRVEPRPPEDGWTPPVAAARRRRA